MAVALGVAALALGSAVLGGWAADLAWLKSLAPGLVAMKPNTALGLVLAGAGVAFLAGGRGGARGFSGICGAAVLLVGGLTLAEYALGWDPGIDQALFRERPGAVDTPSPGRMALQTAASLALLGLALLALGRGSARLQRLGEAAAALAGLVGFQALVGYAYGVEILYDLPRSTSVAAHTALGLTLLSGGLLLARSEGGLLAPLLAAGTGGDLARRLLPAALALPFAVGLVAVAGQGLGLYASPITVSLIVTGVTIVFLLYVTWTAGRAQVLDEGRRRAERAYREEAEIVRTLNEVGGLLTQQLDRPTLVQAITDAATEQTQAAFGAFFFNVQDEEGGKYALYSLSGAPKEAFSKFPLPRRTPLFDPTFRGGPTVRIPDVTRDPRYGRVPPHHGMPAGHLAVRSYLAVPVKSTRAEVMGGLFFGHPEPGVFTETHARLAEGIAAWAGIALENADLYEDLRRSVRNRQEMLSVVSHDMRNALHAVACATEALEVLAPPPLEGSAAPRAPDAQPGPDARRRPDGPRRPADPSRGSGRAERTEGPGTPDELARRALRIVRGSVRRIDRLIRHLLDVDAIGSGRLCLDLSEGSIEAWVRDAVSIVESLPGDREVRLKVSAPPGGAAVRADRERIVQVLSNLLDNAIRFGPSGGRVGVRIEEGDGEVRVSVSDAGPGLPPGELERVFDPFWTGSGRQGTGPGLGLSIARAFIEAHGGRIWAESRVGEGATFHFSLPGAAARGKEGQEGGRGEAEAVGDEAVGDEVAGDGAIQEKRPRAFDSPRP